MSEAKPNEQPTEAAPLAFRVTRGGEPTAQELAALVVALTPGGDDDEAPPGSAWNEAARLEGVGFRAFVSVDDVTRYHRNLA